MSSATCQQSPACSYRSAPVGETRLVVHGAHDEAAGAVAAPVVEAVVRFVGFGAAQRRARFAIGAQHADAARRMRNECRSSLVVRQRLGDFRQRDRRGLARCRIVDAAAARALST